MESGVDSQGDDHLMDIKAPEPQDAFQGYMIAMVQMMHSDIQGNSERVQKLEAQAQRVLGVAATLGAIGGFVAIVISRLTGWKS